MKGEIRLHTGFRCTLIAACAAASLLFASCAATPSFAGHEAALDASFAQVQNDLDAIKSVSLRATTELVLRQDTDTTRIKQVSDVVQHIDPIELSVKNTLSCNGQVTTGRMIVREEYGLTLCYLQENGGAWSVATDEPLSSFEQGHSFYSHEALDFFQKRAGAFRFAESDVLNGVRCSVVEARFTGEDMPFLVRHAGMFGLLQDTLLEPDQQSDAWRGSWDKAWESLYDNSPACGIKVKAWLVDQSHLPLRYQIDMTEVCNALMREQARHFPREETTRPVLRRFTYDLTLKDYNQAAHISLPPEAAKAAAPLLAEAKKDRSY